MPSSLSGERTLALPILADGETVTAQVVHGAAGPQVIVSGSAPAADALAVAAGDAIYVLRRGRQTKVSLRDLALDEASDERKFRAGARADAWQGASCAGGSRAPP